jgi:hypothetical protein
MNVWLRLSATFHEHPKMLAVRVDAVGKADSAELGWYRLLMAAKRYGRWTFASEAHLEHVAGPYYRFVALYRTHHLLDGLTVHDGETYNAIKTPAERKEEQRQRDKESRGGVTDDRDMPRDTNVTLEERDKRDKKEERDSPASAAADRDCLDTYYELTLYRPWGQWSGDKLREAATTYGDENVSAAMRAEATADPDRKTLIDRTLAGLARGLEREQRNRKPKPRTIRVVTDAERAAAMEEIRRESLS